MSEAKPDRERFDALVALYAAGTLNADDRAWMNAYLKAHPEAAAELQWHVGMAQQLQARFDAVPSDIGLDKAKARVKQWPKRATASSTTAGPSGFKRVLEWFFGGAPRFSPALAFLLLLAILPATLLLQQPEHTQFRGDRSGIFDGPLLRVNFKSEARESDIRFLLLEQGGLVVGPTRLGDWFVRVAPDRIDKVRETLSKSAFVVSVDVVPGLPTELVDP